MKEILAMSPHRNTQQIDNNLRERRQIMAVPLAFISGAISGIGALVATALIADDGNGKLSYNLYNPKNFATMTAPMLSEYLDAYSTNMMKLNRELMELKQQREKAYKCEKGIFYMINNNVGNPRNNSKAWKGLFSIRNSDIKFLSDIQMRAARIFGLYRPVFIRANEIFNDHGMCGYSIDSSLLSENFSIDNNLPIDEWSEKYGHIYSKLQGFLFKSSRAASFMMRYIPTTSA